MTFKELYDSAVKYVNPRQINENVSVNSVACALETKDSNVYYGVGHEIKYGLGMTAVQAAVAAMITNGETVIDKIVLVGENGKVVVPTGIGRELILELDAANNDTEVLLSLEPLKMARFKNLLPLRNN